MRLPSELDAMVLSPAKARRLLGWRPRVKLAEGIREEWEWLLDGGLRRWRKASY